MGLINLPSLDDILSIKDPKQQMEALLNTVGILMKELGEINGYLGGANIKAKSITAQKIDVQQLSAITANMGKLTSGEIYGAYISTAEATYPRIEFSSTGNLMAAYLDVNNSIKIVPNSAGAPGVEFYRAGVLQGTLKVYSGGLEFTVPAAGFLSIRQGNLFVPNINNIQDGITSVGTELGLKANKSSITKTVYVAATSGAAATTPMTITNGVVTG